MLRANVSSMPWIIVYASLALTERQIVPATLQR